MDFNNEELVARRWMVREEELDDNQYQIKMMKMGDYLIDGCAGSGKTILALQKAKQIQDLKLGTYLVIVYTHTLKSFIKDGIKSLNLDPDRVCNYDSLERKGFNSADYIIVDEIQDLQQHEINRLKEMANKNFIFFGDDAQQLYGRRNNNITLKQIQISTGIDNNNYKVLDKNYRLPQSIARFAQSLHPDAGNLAVRCTKSTGEKPLVLKCANDNEQLNYIINVIKNETLQDVSILVSKNDEVRNIEKYFKSIGFEAEYKYNNEEGMSKINLDFYTNRPKVMTYHSSKGLQFEHVFMPLCECDYSNYNFKEAMYVAVTRASQNLTLLYTNSLSPFVQTVDSTLYNHRIK